MCHCAKKLSNAHETYPPCTNVYCLSRSEEKPDLFFICALARIPAPSPISLVELPPRGRAVMRSRGAGRVQTDVSGVSLCHMAAAGPTGLRAPQRAAALFRWCLRWGRRAGLVNLFAFFFSPQEISLLLSLFFRLVKCPLRGFGLQASMVVMLSGVNGRREGEEPSCRRVCTSWDIGLGRRRRER